jgi:mannosyltransferase OCH1-like enzyme
MMKKNKIPKKIHYCWFGNNPLPEEYKKNIESWKKYMPDYEIIQWNESNYDVNKIPYTRYAYENKKWAFVTDYARLDIIYNYGGIYLDTDVEVLKSFDKLLDNDAFMGVENGNYVNTGLGFGAIPKHFGIGLNKQIYENFVLNNNYINLINCPEITTNLLKKYGAKLDGTIENIIDIKIYPIEYFCPMNYFTGVTKITNNTYSIHKYSMSWNTKLEKKQTNFTKKISKVIPNNISRKISKIIFSPLKFIDRLFNEGLKWTFNYYKNKIFKGR